MCVCVCVYNTFNDQLVDVIKINHITPPLRQHYFDRHNWQRIVQYYTSIAGVYTGVP